MNQEIFDLDLDLLDADNVKKYLDPQYVKELAESIALIDQQAPIITFRKGKRFGIVDGHGRTAAKRLIGDKTIKGIVLDEAPTPSQLRLLQCTLALQHNDVNVADLAEAFALIMEQEGWTATDLAGQVCKSLPTISRILATNKLTPEHRELVRQGLISSSASAALARMEPEDRQPFVDKLLAGEVTRDDLNKAARKKSAKPKKKPPKQERLAFDVNGFNLALAADKPITYELMQEMLRELSKLISKARHQRICIEIFAKWLRNVRENGDATPGEVSP